MDGVPVKISEKYKPPKRISLPGSVLNKINVLKETKIEDYDFSFERAVLAQVGRINEYQKSVQEKKKKKAEERIKQIEEATDRLSMQQSSSAADSPPSPTSESESTQFAMPPPVSTNINMLAPLPVTNTAILKERRKVDNSILSEFEFDTSSPFDNMELKSINDLQELADVLGSSNKPSAVKEDKVNKPLNGVSQQWQTKMGEHDPRNYAYPTCQYYTGVYPISTVYHPSYVSHPISTDHSYQRYMPEYKPYQPSLSPPFVSPVPPPLPPKPPALSSNPTTSSPAHSYRYPPATTALPLTSPHYLQPSPSRQIDQAEIPPRLDPTKVSLWSDLQKTVEIRKVTSLEERTPKSAINNPRPSLPNTEASSTPPTYTDTLPNPLSNLSQEGHALARRMSEMGFPLARSARAVELLNSDEAKVIEYLLQVQNFEDKGLSGDLVETILDADNFSDKSTLEYLENVKKLMDFGFVEDKVLGALKQASFDPDRALDLLIS